MSNLLQIAAIACVASSSTATHALPVLFESATLGPTGVQGGALVDMDHFVGVRFSVQSETRVSGVGGQFWGTPDNNDLFAAILKLPHQFALPAPGSPFDSSELVTSTVFATPVDRSDDVVIPLATTLAPGHYGLVFGSGAFGANGFGAMNGGTDVDDPSYFFSSDGSWIESGFGGRRFVIYVPETSTIALLAMGGLFPVRRR